MLFRRILVVDDEPIQREVLAEIVKKITPEAEVIACCDGEEAWNICQEYHGKIELLLTDINMPGLDGVGLIQRVAESYPSVKLVFISAYQEFEYARNAIRYGVKDYLLKPFRIQTARELLERVNSELEEEQAAEQKRGEYESFLKMEEQKRQLQELFLERRREDQLDREIRNRFPGAGNIVVFRWKLSTGNRSPRYCARLSARQQDELQSRIHQEFSEACFLPQEHGLDETERRMILLQTENVDQTINKLQGLLAEMKKKGIVFWAGVSGQKTHLLQEISDAFRQAEEILAFFFYSPSDGGIYSWDTMHMMLEQPMISVSSFEKELKAAVRTQNEGGTGEALKRLEKTLIRQGKLSPVRMKHCISSMIVSILKEAEGMISQQEYDSLLNEAYEAYGTCDSLIQLFDISEEILDKISVGKKNRSEEFDAVEQCISYIREHIQEELSLQSLAELVHFHPTYLSARIKEKVGMSYSSFILSIRMEQAGRMLRETDWKVLKVAQKCGFKDSSYFNRIFRREFGISPEQYRKVHRSC